MIVIKVITKLITIIVIVIAFFTQTAQTLSHYIIITIIVIITIDILKSQHNFGGTKWALLNHAIALQGGREGDKIYTLNC